MFQQWHCGRPQDKVAPFQMMKPSLLPEGPRRQLTDIKYIMNHLMGALKAGGRPDVRAMGWTEATEAYSWLMGHDKDLQELMRSNTAAKRGKKSRKRRPDQLSWRTHSDALRKLHKGRGGSKNRRKKVPQTGRPVRKRR